MKLTLIVVPESTTSLRGLWNEALPEVIRAMEDSGYTVDRQSGDEPTEHGWQCRCAVQPEPATLIATADDRGDPHIDVILYGERFGQKGLRYGNYDEALWDRLEALGQRLGRAHAVVQTFGDPDFVTGGHSDPGTPFRQGGID